MGTNQAREKSGLFIKKKNDVECSTLGFLVFYFSLLPKYLIFYNPALDFGKRAMKSVTRLPMYRY